MKTKKCKKCHKTKNYTDFWVDNHLLDGFTSSCKLCINTLRRIKYKEKHKNRIPKRKKKNKEELREYRKKWYHENKDRYKIYRDRSKKSRNQYKKDRKKKDPLFRMRINISEYMRKIIKSKGFMKSKKMESILGMNFHNYKIYLENLFQKGMNWNNWSSNGWHIDHIIPLCSAKDETELLKLLHYSNTRPLWAKDNLSKGGRWLS